MCINIVGNSFVLWEQRGHVVSSTVRFGISVDDDNDNIKPGRITMKPGSQSQSL